MICLTHRTDYIPDAINRHFVISFFFGRGWGWGHQLYKVQFVPLKICTVWLHKSSLMDRSLHGSLKNKASRSSNMCGLFSDHLGSHPNSVQPEPKEQL